MIKEIIQDFFHMKFIRRFMANLMAMYLSIDSVIKENKLAINDTCNDIWNSFSNKWKSGFFIKYSW